MAKVSVMFVNNDNQPLSGGAAELVCAETGQIIAQAVPDQANDGGSVPFMRGKEHIDVEPGRYLIKSTIPPILQLESGDADEDGGAEGSLVCYFDCPSRLVMVDEEDTAYFLYHKQTAIKLNTAPGAPKAHRSVRRFLQDVGSCINPPSDEDMARLAGLWIASLALIAAAWMLLAAPFVWVLSFSLANIAQQGFGWSFLANNVAGYVKGYLLSGWDAVAALKAAYPASCPNPLAPAIVDIAAIAWLCSLATKRFVKIATPFNPILEHHPAPSEDSVVQGSAKLVTDKEEVTRLDGVRTLPATAKSAEDMGAYLGFYGKPVSSELVDAAVLKVYKDAMAIPERRRARQAAKENRPYEPKDIPALFEPSPYQTRGDRAYNLMVGKLIERAPHLCYDRRGRLRFPGALEERSHGLFVYNQSSLHTAIFGDTGCGKTRRVLLSTIYLLSLDPTESAVILDPKGELYGLTSGYLRSQGIQTPIINFRSPLHSDRWNPLGLALEAYRQGDIQKAVSHVKDLIADIAPRQENEGNAKYFNDTARDFMTSAALALMNPRTGCPDDQVTLASVSRLIEVLGPPIPGKSPQDVFSPYGEYLNMLPADDPAVDAFAGHANDNPKEMRSFCSTVQTFLAMYRDPAMAEMMSETDNPFSKIATERQFVFVVIPDNKPAYAPFAKVYLNQAYTYLADFSCEGQSGDGMAGSLPQRVNFICEELCSIPKWDTLTTTLNIARGRNMRFWLVIQSKAIFDAKYERDVGAVLGNVAHSVFLKTRDAEGTGRYFEEHFGAMTVEDVTVSLSGSRLSPFKLHKTETTSNVKRSILMVDEIARWKPAYGSITKSGDCPFVVPLPDVSRTPVQRALGLGSVEHNLTKTYHELFELIPARTLSVSAWYPEYTFKDKNHKASKVKVSARRGLRKQMYDELRQDYLKRTATERASSPQQRDARRDEGKASARNSYVAFFNDSTGESRFSPMSQQALEDAQNLYSRAQGWEMATFEAKDEATAWISNMRTSHSARDAIARAEAAEAERDALSRENDKLARQLARGAEKARKAQKGKAAQERKGNSQPEQPPGKKHPNGWSGRGAG